MKLSGDGGIEESRRLRYWPNPAHKTSTTEAGPPAWRPRKTPCPRMTIDERQDLLERSICLEAATTGTTGASRYAMRRGVAGLEFFEARWTERRGDDDVFHGFPTVHVPARILRSMRDRGDITEAEYRRFLRDLG